MMDAVRVLPIVGLGLWMVPLLWPSGEGADHGHVSVSNALLYIFGIWIALIVASGLLWIRTRAATDEPPGTDPS